MLPLRMADMFGGVAFQHGLRNPVRPHRGRSASGRMGLETKFFTQGCDRLTVATDHKPLKGLLGQKSIDQVANACLFQIKQRISMWKFKVIYCPGKANFFANAT